MLEDSLWDLQASLPSNGGSFLVDQFRSRKACWDYHGIKTTSRHIPGVDFAGIHDFWIDRFIALKGNQHQWNKREKELFDKSQIVFQHWQHCRMLIRLTWVVWLRVEAAEAAKDDVRTVSPTGAWRQL